MDEQTVAQILALPSVQALRPKQRLFVVSYVRTGNGTRAAIEAGYKENPRHSWQVSGQASRMLGRADVALAVREALAVRWRAIAMCPDEVLARAARIARHDHRKVLAVAARDPTLSSLDDDTAEAITGAKIRREIDKHGAVKAETVEYRTASKVAALELLARYHRLLAAPDADDVGQAFAAAMDAAARRRELRQRAADAVDADVIEGAAFGAGDSTARADYAAGEQFAAGAAGAAGAAASDA